MFFWRNLSHLPVWTWTKFLLHTFILKIVWRLFIFITKSCLSTHKTFPLTNLCAEFTSQKYLFPHIKRKYVDGWLLYYFVFKGTDLFIETNKLLLPESSRKFEPVNNAYPEDKVKKRKYISCEKTENPISFTQEWQIPNHASLNTQG